MHVQHDYFVHTVPLRDSILSLVNIVAALTCRVKQRPVSAPSKLELSAPLTKVERVKVDAFISTLFFRSHVDAVPATHDTLMNWVALDDCVLTRDKRSHFEIKSCFVFDT